MAEVELLETSVPELPLGIDHVTGRFEVKVSTAFSPADVAEGVMTSPPLVTAATPVPVIGTIVGELG